MPKVDVTITEKNYGLLFQNDALICTYGPTRLIEMHERAKLLMKIEPVKESERGYKIVSPEEREEMIMMYKSGKSYFHIANEMGRSELTVKAHLERSEFELRDRDQERRYYVDFLKGKLKKSDLRKLMPEKTNNAHNLAIWKVRTSISKADCEHL